MFQIRAMSWMNLFFFAKQLLKFLHDNQVPICIQIVAWATREKEKLWRESAVSGRSARVAHGGKVGTREVNLAADWRWWRAVSDQSLCWSSHRHAWRLVIAAHHLSCRVVLSLLAARLITMDPISYSSRALLHLIHKILSFDQRSIFISTSRHVRIGIRSGKYFTSV